MKKYAYILLTLFITTTGCSNTKNTNSNIEEPLMVATKLTEAHTTKGQIIQLPSKTAQFDITNQITFRYSTLINDSILIKLDLNTQDKIYDYSLNEFLELLPETLVIKDEENNDMLKNTNNIDIIENSSTRYEIKIKKENKSYDYLKGKSFTFNVQGRIIPTVKSNLLSAVHTVDGCSIYQNTTIDDKNYIADSATIIKLP